MNEKFFSLPEDRQHVMLNAGFAVFSRNAYKKASMDDVAREAGMSKALLFHYFESKSGLYLYLHHYAMDYLVERLSSQLYADGETDFFALLARSQALKLEILRDHPDLMQFLVKGYFEESDEVSPDVRGRLFELVAASGAKFASRADASKFVDGVSVDEAANIVLWFSDGFMRAQPAEKLADMDALNAEYLDHLDVLRRCFLSKGIPVNDKEKVIEATGLTKRYGRARGIEDVDLVVRRGEIFGFIGPNGAGKSTFVRVLLGLIRATDGQARILGMPCEPSAKPLLARVGYLPSEIQFYHGMRVGELVKFSARLRHCDCSAEAARLADRLGLDMKRKIDDLSLGNRKKVGVVCALQHEPELLILDEPTSGLDPLVQQEFFALLEERRAAGGTVMLSSHVLSEVQRYCDRAAVIREGRIIAEGSVEELASTSARRVRVVAAAPVEAPVLEGVRSFEPRADGASFLFQGDMGALVAWLATLPVLDVTIEEPDLDEVFMHFYTGEEDAGMGGEAGAASTRQEYGRAEA